jgi:hypothetical protein
MPSFKVRTPISHGLRKDDGSVESKEYLPGDTIELTLEEAVAISHAIEKAPTSVKKLPKDVQEAVDSVRNRPDHPDSGIQADWKVDAFARANAGGARRASEVGIAANEAIGHGFERSNEPDEATAGSEPGKGKGPIKASEIPPGVDNKGGGELTEPPQGKEVAKAQTQKKNPASVE